MIVYSPDLLHRLSQGATIVRVHAVDEDPPGWRVSETGERIAYGCAAMIDGGELPLEIIQRDLFGEPYQLALNLAGAKRPPGHAEPRPGDWGATPHPPLHHRLMRVGSM